MKNKYIFLIVALGFAAYFLVKPQAGISDDLMAQITPVICTKFGGCSGFPGGAVPANGGGNFAPRNVPSGTQTGGTPLITIMDRNINPISFTAMGPFGDTINVTSMACGRPRREKGVGGTLGNCFLSRTGPAYTCCKERIINNRWRRTCSVVS